MTLSRKIRFFPGLATTTMLLIHTVGAVSFLIIPFVSRSASLAYSSFRRATGIRHEVCWTGTAQLLGRLLQRMYPSPSTISLKSCSILFVVRGICFSFRLRTSALDPNLRSPNFWQVWANGKGLFEPLNTWNSRTWVCEPYVILRLNTPRGFIMDPSNSRSLVLLCSIGGFPSCVMIDKSL